VTYDVEVESLSKRYRIGRLKRYGSLRESLVESLRRPFAKHAEERASSIWALRDVSFRVERGEVVGIIGRNGAGKSTLLKILSRITYPTEGRAKVVGRLASLLEVGTGFHDELTGRENIYLNGSILGMRKREVDARFDRIVEFSGVGPFIDTPIKRYSSGMRLRLGFSVAAHLEPDVLVVDEVLAVGDAGFQKRCLETMDGLRSGGRTVLFVSHNMAAVENLCSRAIWIEAGGIRMDAGAKETIAAYMASFAGDQAAGSELSGQEGRVGTGEIRFTRLEFLGPDGTPCGTVRSGDAVVMRLHYRAEKAVPHPSFGFRLYSGMGTLVTETSTWHHGFDVPAVPPGQGHLDLEIDLLNLVPGRYSVSLWVTGLGGTPVYDGDVRAAFDVEVSNVYGSGRMLDGRYGLVYFPQRWRFEGRTSAPGSDPPRRGERTSRPQEKDPRR
jgi:lipopolysaccharide transport system ATP-binding protein